MSPFPLRCPSCGGGNPAGANFCNNCGMPVNLEPCACCDAINRRGADRCHKCGSLFVEIEPAFIHCRYCGSLSRIHGASLLAQEEWETRSGMRLAS